VSGVWHPPVLAFTPYDAVVILLADVSTSYTIDSNLHKVPQSLTLGDEAHKVKEMIYCNRWRP